MPRLSPSALRSASPSASATSSTVWCSSMCRSPVHCDVEREAAVLAELLEHVVEEAESGLRTRLGFAIEIDAHADVGLTGAANDLGDARPVEHGVRDRGPALGAGASDLVALEAEVARELDVGVAVADHRRTLAIERRRVHVVADEPDGRFAAGAAGLGRVRADEVRGELDPLRGRAARARTRRRARTARAGSSACRDRPGW